MNKGFFLFLGIFILSFLIGLTVGIKYPFDNTDIFTRELREGEFNFINPLLECESSISKTFTPFQDKIELLINEKTKSDRVEKASVYFKDLNKGLWIGVNQESSFAPASLLKVPLMIAYYKVAEEDKAFLEKEIKYLGDSDLNRAQFFFDKKNRLIKGSSYTIDNLIERSIKYSDNNAMNLLFEYISNNNKLERVYSNVYKTLGIPLPSMDDSKKDIINIVEYSSFFRVLYNASYLNSYYSNKALELLSKTEYGEGLVASLPKDLKVSHKFGERNFNDYSIEEYSESGSIADSGTSVYQLHDCGIVYFPKRPYLLCVMTRGDDPEELAQAIREVSKLVYDEVRSQTK